MTGTLWRRPFAFGLLVAQLLGSGAVSLAHARERVDAPHHIESAQSGQCLVVHDAATCVLCAFAQARASAPAPLATAFVLPATTRSTAPALAALPRVPAPPGGDARAPPPAQG